MIMEYVWAFVIGGLFCAVGEVLIDYTKLTPARILTAYVVAGVILGALGWYQPLVDFAGAGASVPLTGFGNVLVQGVQKAVDEKGFLGVFTWTYRSGRRHNCSYGLCTYHGLYFQVKREVIFFALPNFYRRQSGYIPLFLQNSLKNVENI